jgi:DNA-binding transcriptional MocR family regulator
MTAAHQGPIGSHFVAAETLVAQLGAWTHRAGPRYVRLADALGDLLGQDGLPEGARLPSERELALRLGVSRGTVVSAYAALAERGAVTRRQGSGTRVAGDRSSPGAAAVLRNPQFGRFITGPEVPIDLSFGAPHLDDLVAGLQGGVAEAARAGVPAHGYAPLGLPGLRDALAGRISARGVPCRPEEVLVTTGAQGALALLTAALVRPGDRVVVEAPTYPGAIELFSRAGATLVALERDHTGPRPEDLRRALSGVGAALVFLVPTCHNPTGAVMHEQRRRELLAVCTEHGVPVIEDETTAELLWDGTAPPSMASRNPDGVISVGSFSKVLWGGLRVGWIRAARPTILRIGRLKAAQDLGSGLLDQVAVLRVWPELDAIAEARRGQARRRHDTLTAALAARLPDWRIAPCRGGYSVWVRLPHGTGDDLAAAALEQGVAVSSGSSSAPQDLFLDHVRLCFAAPPAQLEEAAERLEVAWRVAAARSAVAAG